MVPATIYTNIINSEGQGVVTKVQSLQEKVRTVKVFSDPVGEHHWVCAISTVNAVESTGARTSSQVYR